MGALSWRLNSALRRVRSVRQYLFRCPLLLTELLGDTAAAVAAPCPSPSPNPSPSPDPDPAPAPWPWACSLWHELLLALSRLQFFPPPLLLLLLLILAASECGTGGFLPVAGIVWLLPATLPLSLLTDPRCPGRVLDASLPLPLPLPLPPLLLLVFPLRDPFSRSCCWRAATADKAGNCWDLDAQDTDAEEELAGAELDCCCGCCCEVEATCGCSECFFSTRYKFRYLSPGCSELSDTALDLLMI